MNFSRSQPLRIIILDDQPIFLRGVHNLFQHEFDIKLLGSVSDCTDLDMFINDADILLMDFALLPQKKNGINLINYLHKHHPNLYILVMSSFYSASSVSMALRNGARGFIHKQASEAEMINAVKVVGSGNVYLELEMAVLLAQLHYAEMQASSRHAPPTQEASRVSLSSLSPKVQEVIHGLLEGMTVKEIAQKYGRSIKTISGQKQTGMRKLGLKSNRELYLLRHNLDCSA
ncbi:response regulator transcription factor [Enterobacter kobei]|uniref:response regulator transcription factor n=1 Tax=Enterobacter kobei TaxID=208224 RepID=UPI002003CD1D|nr:response regulator transcription factor [Enterobacter kobei]MCK7248213.1 response regulator transcription factor [Enterobacter kobei]